MVIGGRITCLTTGRCLAVQVPTIMRIPLDAFIRLLEGRALLLI